MTQLHPVGALHPVPERMGPYKVLRHLATGGMATLYLAEHPMFGQVVIKRLLPKLEQEPAYLKMFRDEARLSARLRHPNLVKVIDIHNVGSNHFFTMEMLCGADLMTIHRQLRAKRQPLPLIVAVGIVLEVCRALDYAHQQVGPLGQALGIVHRDVSPQNIFVTTQGTVKLLDFGIAKSADRETQTRTGIIKGKFWYMSPEQVTSRTLDGRSDLFSLSVILWELTTGKRMYAGTKTELDVMRRLVRTAATPPSAVCPDYPADLNRIVVTGLQRDPQTRYASAGAMVAELERFVAANHLELSASQLAAWIQDLLRDAPAPSAPAPERACNGVEPLGEVAGRRVDDSDPESWYDDFEVCAVAPGAPSAPGTRSADDVTDVEIDLATLCRSQASELGHRGGRSRRALAWMASRPVLAAGMLAGLATLVGVFWTT